MISGQVIIHLIVPGAISPEEAMTYLNPDEIHRAKRFHFADDATHWMSCRAQLKRVLGREIGLAPKDVSLVLADYGKPLLSPPYAGLHFNLSHSAELALLALCIDGPVGIDLEKESRGIELLGCESTFCHPQEIKDLPNDLSARAARLLKIWTNKEAVLKALGSGLSYPPELVRILFDPHPRRAISDTAFPGMEGQWLQTLHHPALADYQAAVSMPTSIEKILLGSSGI